MKLSELIAHVGDEHVTFQPLQNSFVNAKVKKHDAEITFATDKAHAQQLMDAIVRQSKPDSVGIVVWMPRERMPEAMR